MERVCVLFRPHCIISASIQDFEFELSTQTKSNLREWASKDKGNYRSAPKIPPSGGLGSTWVLIELFQTMLPF